MKIAPTMGVQDCYLKNGINYWVSKLAIDVHGERL
jgi:hypothetical protein